MDLFWIVPKTDVGIIPKLDKHMIIAPWLKKYRDYKSAYARVHGAKILDNGAYEGLEISTSEYIELAETFRVNYVVCPDMSPRELFEEDLLENFLDELPSKFRPIVPVHTFEEKYLVNYIELCEHYGLIPGLPKRPRYQKTTIYDRCKVANIFAERLPHIHFLGLDLTVELSFIKQIPAYITVDTSLPYKYSSVEFNPEVVYDYAKVDVIRETLERFSRGEYDSLQHVWKTSERHSESH